MLPLHQATDSMYSNISVLTPEAIQPPYNMLYRSIQNPITLQQQSNIDMRFNSYIDQERNYNVQGYVFLGAHNTINENQFVLSSLSSCDANESSCLFWLLKCTVNIAKMVSSKSHLSSLMYNSMHNWHELSCLLALGKSSIFKQISNNFQTKNLYKSNPECS